jgi:hypothetical protein
MAQGKFVIMNWIIVTAIEHYRTCETLTIQKTVRVIKNFRTSQEPASWPEKLRFTPKLPECRIKFVKIMVPRGWYKGHNWENNILIHVFYNGNKSLEIFFRTSQPISIKLGKNHSWLKGIPVCINKGSCFH